ncbi:2-C-methyl-D-erythritol 2,4-cyclodiphosphate synthase [bacterium]|nr:2-C-methyl-D-erythritol 2,4-cyclodiphosphate synthase [bacterium]
MDDILKRLEKLENITSFEYFTGIGFDSHRFDPSKMGIVLGGVNVPYKKGFYAHSDGDVFFHAIIDSLLGASSMGDIGTLFPDTDPSYKGISSSVLLEDVVKRLHSKGFQIVNIDTVIIAEEPKLFPYKREIAKNTALICGIDENHVGVKAKTNEKMGFLGRGEGIAVMSSALLKR